MNIAAMNPIEIAEIVGGAAALAIGLAAMLVGKGARAKAAHAAKALEARIAPHLARHPNTVDPALAAAIAAAPAAPAAPDASGSSSGAATGQPSPSAASGGTDRVAQKHAQLDAQIAALQAQKQAVSDAKAKLDQLTQ